MKNFGVYMQSLIANIAYVFVPLNFLRLMINSGNDPSDLFEMIAFYNILSLLFIVIGIPVWFKMVGYFWNKSKKHGNDYWYDYFVIALVSVGGLLLGVWMFDRFFN